MPTLSPSTVAAVQATFPALRRKPVLPLRHPAYPNAALSTDARASARMQRGWEDSLRVIGYFGQIRAYKGLEELVLAFRQTDDADLRLFVAGLVRDENLGAQLRAAAVDDARISLEFTDLPEDAFRTALNTCDLFVAPMRRYLHSGSLVHALSAGRPVFTPRTPFAVSLQDDLGDGWVRLYEGALDPTYLTSTARQESPSIGPNMALFAPERVASDAVAAMMQLIKGTSV